MQAHVETVVGQAVEKVTKSPAIAFAKHQHNESRWNGAFERLCSNSELEGLEANKLEFKEKYFDPNLVPENIDEVLQEAAQSFLFRKLKDNQEGQQVASERVELEDTTGGSKTPSTVTNRTIEEWQKLQQENPAKFAAEKKQFDEDMASGRLQE